MQERVKAIDALAEKYIQIVAELKRENASLKTRLGELEQKYRLLEITAAGGREDKKIKNLLIKKLSRLNDKIEKELKKAD